MSVRTIKTAIKKFNKFLVSAHINPEGDSIGSQIAMASLLKRLGKGVVILNEGPVPHILQFMKGTEDVMKEMPASFDTFDGAKTPPFKAGKQAPLSINPEQPPVFKSGCVERVDFEAAIILDCPDLTRVGNVVEHIAKGKSIINIDLLYLSSKFIHHLFYFINIRAITIDRSFLSYCPCRILRISAFAKKERSNIFLVVINKSD